MGSGGRGRFGPLPGFLGEGRLIRPPRITTGPPKRLEADRERTGASDLPGPKAPAGLGPAPETRPPTRADGFDLKIAERSGAIRTRSARERPLGGDPGRAAGT